MSAGSGAPGTGSYRLAPATAADLPVIRELLREYERAIGVDLCFQGFARELAGLPGAYAPPRGCLLLLRAEDGPAGCVALRPLADVPGTAEMKRLYVRSNHRGLGLGRWLAMEVIERARSAGYDAIRLDTLPSMTKAAALYVSMGFREILPSGDLPVAGIRYFELSLG